MNSLNILLQTSPNNGAYGIGALTKIVDSANKLWDLTKAVYMDDKKITGEDFADIIALSPGVVSSIVSASKEFHLVDNEITDLSETEKNTLLALIGNRIENPSYMKIVKGLLDITDGISELVNSENPKG